MKKLFIGLLLCVSPLVSRAEIIWTHHGGSHIPINDLGETVSMTVDTFDNILDKENFKKLVIETILVETMGGRAKYDYAAKNWQNFGIAQIKKSTAEYLQASLEKSSPKTFYTLIGLKGDNQDEVYNLSTNVPYAIAVCAQYYLLRFQQSGSMEIATVSQRAKVWKRYYNTYLGKGTEAIYKDRIKEYYGLPDHNLQYCSNEGQGCNITIR